MDGMVFLETLQAVLLAAEIERVAGEFGVVQRSRKLDIVKPVYSLALSARSDDSGVLAEAMKRYNTETEPRQRVVRGGFYAWLDKELAKLMEHLVERAIWYACSLPVFLPGNPRRRERLVRLRFGDDHPSACAGRGLPWQRQPGRGQGAQACVST